MSRTTTTARIGTWGVAALLLAASPAALHVQPGQDSFPSTPPAPGAPRDFAVPAPTRFTLPNGLEVAMVEWGTMPKVLVSLTVAAGNVFEDAKEVWLADLVGDLMREGTATRTSAEISEAAARMGGALNISVGPDMTTIGGDVLSEFAPQMIELVADVARNPAFPESELPRLKDNLTRQLAVARSQPQQLALEQFRSVLYGDHPYGRVFPTEEMIKGFTLPQAMAFYQANYGARRARLYVVGRFDKSAAETAVKKVFTDWAGGSKPDAPPAKPSSTLAIFIVDKPGAVQSTILLGVPVVGPSDGDFIPLSVMNALLGGAFSSRITRNIREDKGYTYSPGSLLSSQLRGTYWAEQADVTTAHTGASLKEIFAEIDRLQAEPPPVEELKGVHNYVSGTFVLQNSSRAGITGQLRYIDLHGLPASYPNEYVQKVFAVTPEAISAMARTHLQDERAAIVIVGDRKVIEEQVKPYGKIVEVK